MDAMPCHDSATKRHGLFLFFLIGLFVLQVIFAYTTHGDIGPRELDAGAEVRTVPNALLEQVSTALAAPPAPGSRPIARPFGPSFTVAPDLTGPVPATSRATAGPDRMGAVTGFTVAPIGTAARLVRTPRAAAVAGRIDEKVGNARFYDYRIQAGDTLATISRRFYGTQGMVPLLVRLNRLQSERGLQIGQILRLPRRGLKTLPESA